MSVFIILSPSNNTRSLVKLVHLIVQWILLTVYVGVLYVFLVFIRDTASIGGRRYSRHSIY